MHDWGTLKRVGTQPWKRPDFPVVFPRLDGAHHRPYACCVTTHGNQIWNVWLERVENMLQSTMNAPRFYACFSLCLLCSNTWKSNLECMIGTHWNDFTQHPFQINGILIGSAAKTEEETTGKSERFLTVDAECALPLTSTPYYRYHWLPPPLQAALAAPCWKYT